MNNEKKRIIKAIRYFQKMFEFEGENFINNSKFRKNLLILDKFIDFSLDNEIKEFEISFDYFYSINKNERWTITIDAIDCANTILYATYLTISKEIGIEVTINNLDYDGDKDKRITLEEFEKHILKVLHLFKW